jgi:hypothetical protein
MYNLDAKSIPMARLRGKNKLPSVEKCATPTNCRTTIPRNKTYLAGNLCLLNMCKLRRCDTNIFNKLFQFEKAQGCNL